MGPFLALFILHGCLFVPERESAFISDQQNFFSSRKAAPAHPLSLASVEAHPLDAAQRLVRLKTEAQTVETPVQPHGPSLLQRTAPPSPFPPEIPTRISPAFPSSHGTEQREGVMMMQGGMTAKPSVGAGGKGRKGPAVEVRFNPRQADYNGNDDISCSILLPPSFSTSKEQATGHEGFLLDGVNDWATVSRLAESLGQDEGCAEMGGVAAVLAMADLIDKRFDGNVLFSLRNNPNTPDQENSSSEYLLYMHFLVLQQLIWRTDAVSFLTHSRRIATALANSLRNPEWLNHYKTLAKLGSTQTVSAFMLKVHHDVMLVRLGHTAPLDPDVEVASLGTLGRQGALEKFGNLQDQFDVFKIPFGPESQLKDYTDKMNVLRAYANFNLDAFLSGLTWPDPETGKATSAEGFTAASALPYVTGLLEQVWREGTERHPFAPHEKIPDLAMAIHLGSVVQRLINKEATLNDFAGLLGGSLMRFLLEHGHVGHLAMYVGWKGYAKAGHAMMLGLRGHFSDYPRLREVDIAVLNTRGGSNLHSWRETGVEKGDGRLDVLPFLPFSAVPWGTLASTNVLERLADISEVTPSDDIKQPHLPIYEAALQPLVEFRDPSRDENAHGSSYVRPQLSGTCTMRSPKVWLQWAIGDGQKEAQEVEELEAAMRLVSFEHAAENMEEWLSKFESGADRRAPLEIWTRLLLEGSRELFRCGGSQFCAPGRGLGIKNRVIEMRERLYKIHPFHSQFDIDGLRPLFSQTPLTIDSLLHRGFYENEGLFPNSDIKDAEGTHPPLRKLNLRTPTLYSGLSEDDLYTFIENLGAAYGTAGASAFPADLFPPKFKSDMLTSAVLSIPLPKPVSSVEVLTDKAALHKSEEYKRDPWMRLSTTQIERLMEVLKDLSMQSLGQEQATPGRPLERVMAVWSMFAMFTRLCELMELYFLEPNTPKKNKIAAWQFFLYPRNAHVNTDLVAKYLKSNAALAYDGLSAGRLIDLRDWWDKRSTVQGGGDGFGSNSLLSGTDFNELSSRMVNMDSSYGSEKYLRSVAAFLVESGYRPPTSGKRVCDKPDNKATDVLRTMKELWNSKAGSVWNHKWPSKGAIEVVNFFLFAISFPVTEGEVSSKELWGGSAARLDETYSGDCRVSVAWQFGGSTSKLELGTQAGQGWLTARGFSKNQMTKFTFDLSRDEVRNTDGSRQYTKYSEARAENHMVYNNADDPEKRRYLYPTSLVDGNLAALIAELQTLEAQKDHPEMADPIQHLSTDTALFAGYMTHEVILQYARQNSMVIDELFRTLDRLLTASEKTLKRLGSAASPRDAEALIFIHAIAIRFADVIGNGHTAQIDYGGRTVGDAAAVAADFARRLHSLVTSEPAASQWTRTNIGRAFSILLASFPKYRVISRSEAVTLLRYQAKRLQLIPNQSDPFTHIELHADQIWAHHSAAIQSHMIAMASDSQSSIRPVLSNLLALAAPVDDEHVSERDVLVSEMDWDCDGISTLCRGERKADGGFVDECYIQLSSPDLICGTNRPPSQSAAVSFPPRMSKVTIDSSVWFMQNMGAYSYSPASVKMGSLSPLTFTLGRRASNTRTDQDTIAKYAHVWQRMQIEFKEGLDRPPSRVAIQAKDTISGGDPEVLMMIVSDYNMRDFKSYSLSIVDKDALSLARAEPEQSYHFWLSAKERTYSFRSSDIPDVMAITDRRSGLESLRLESVMPQAMYSRKVTARFGGISAKMSTRRFYSIQYVDKQRKGRFDLGAFEQLGAVGVFQEVLPEDSPQELACHRVEFKRYYLITKGSSTLLSFSDCSESESSEDSRRPMSSLIWEQKPTFAIAKEQKIWDVQPQKHHYLVVEETDTGERLALLPLKFYSWASGPGTSYKQEEIKGPEKIPVISVAVNPSTQELEPSDRLGRLAAAYHSMAAGRYDSARRFLKQIADLHPYSEIEKQVAIMIIAQDDPLPKAVSLRLHVVFSFYKALYEHGDQTWYQKSDPAESQSDLEKAVAQLYRLYLNIHLHLPHRFRLLISSPNPEKEEGGDVEAALLFSAVQEIEFIQRLTQTPPDWVAARLRALWKFVGHPKIAPNPVIKISTYVPKAFDGDKEADSRDINLVTSSYNSQRSEFEMEWSSYDADTLKACSASDFDRTPPGGSRMSEREAFFRARFGRRQFQNHFIDGYEDTRMWCSFMSIIGKTPKSSTYDLLDFYEKTLKPDELMATLHDGGSYEGKRRRPFLGAFLFAKLKEGGDLPSGKGEDNPPVYDRQGFIRSYEDLNKQAYMPYTQRWPHSFCTEDRTRSVTVKLPLALGRLSLAGKSTGTNIRSDTPQLLDILSKPPDRESSTAASNSIPMTLSVEDVDELIADTKAQEVEAAKIARSCFLHAPQETVTPADFSAILLPEDDPFLQKCSRRVVDEASEGRKRLAAELWKAAFHLSDSCSPDSLRTDLEGISANLRAQVAAAETKLQGLWDEAAGDEDRIAVDLLGLEDERAEWKTLIPLYIRASLKPWRARLRHVVDSRKAEGLGKKLQANLFSRLYAETALAHVQRALEGLEDFEASETGSEKDRVLSGLATGLQAERVNFHALLRVPAILVFEYFANLRLRDDQATDMERILQLDPEGSGESRQQDFDPMIVQRLMGGGKTFVLGTLLAMSKADGYHLSLLVPPSALFETNAQDMAQRTWKFFQQKARFIFFERQSSNRIEVERLRFLRRTLERSIRQHDYLVLPPPTAHTLQNSFVELLYEKAHSTDLRDPKLAIALQELAALLQLLRSRGAAVFDEIDVTFDPKTEHNFPLALKAVPQVEMLTMVARLYSFAGVNTDMKKFIQVRQPSQAEAATLHYDTKLQPLLTEEAVRLVWEDKGWKNVICLGEMSGEGKCKEKVRTFLSSNERTKESPNGQAQRSIAIQMAKTNSEGLELLSLLHRQLWVLFKSTWMKTVNLHFGRSSSRPLFPLPVPYSAANTPNEKSEFADRWEVVNRACMTYLVDGLNVPQTKQWVIIMKEQLAQEEEEALESEGQETAHHTAQSLAALRNGLPSQKRFRALMGEDDESLISLVRVDAWDPAMVAKVSVRLREGREDVHVFALMEFVREHVLTEVSSARKQIIANPQNLGAMFNSVQGYSGTLENPYIFPFNIFERFTDFEASQEQSSFLQLTEGKPIENEGIFLDRGANGKVMDRILSSGCAVVDITPSDPAARLSPATALRLVHSDRVNSGGGGKDGTEEGSAAAPLYTALIDVGVLFKSFTNEETARAILGRPAGVSVENDPDTTICYRCSGPNPITGVIYFDEMSNTLKMLLASEALSRNIPGTRPSDILAVAGSPQVASGLFSYYDHRHITGVDIKQLPEAAAVLTMSGDAPLRDLLQGAMRMRQFLSTQSIDFAVAGNAYVASVSKSGRPDINLLFQKAQLHQFEWQRLQNRQVAGQMLSNEVRVAVLDRILQNFSSCLYGEGNSNDGVCSEGVEKAFKVVTPEEGSGLGLFIRSLRENFSADFMQPHEKVFFKEHLERLKARLLEALGEAEGYLPKLAGGEEESLSKRIGDRMDTMVAAFPMPSDEIELSTELDDMPEGVEVEMQMEVEVEVEVEIQENLYPAGISMRYPENTDALISGVLSYGFDDWKRSSVQSLPDTISSALSWVLTSSNRTAGANEAAEEASKMFFSDPDPWVAVQEEFAKTIEMPWTGYFNKRTTSDILTKYRKKPVGLVALTSTRRSKWVKNALLADLFVFSTIAKPQLNVELSVPNRDWRSFSVVLGTNAPYTVSHSPTESAERSGSSPLPKKECMPVAPLFSNRFRLMQLQVLVLDGRVGTIDRPEWFYLFKLFLAVDKKRAAKIRNLWLSGWLYLDSRQRAAVKASRALKLLNTANQKDALLYDEEDVAAEKEVFRQRALYARRYELKDRPGRGIVKAGRYPSLAREGEEDQWEGLPTWAIVLFWLMGIAAVGGAVVFGYWYLKKRREESPMEAAGREGAGAGAGAGEQAAVASAAVPT
uniref:DUF3638 domain-containing protein n=1 Tax=Chromera velia CCMP2878 TaxID=1169474 RepID=A0A0G4I867_9ALVE|eukprot:Cvel_1965.t1-p1 / transcript=Cvel_1965.t1 / gene=Cvel_1965 / organism=Chromera_velia_CCMP2878 / gene_product=hypothetical protein / transcript_product=hypothetical protein / location=Cvel_scaffold74:127587-145443(-) / protein_length=3956 / sequence_SO=supercontig / SO=protein_coding / is_pseudo=false